MSNVPTAYKYGNFVVSFAHYYYIHFRAEYQNLINLVLVLIENKLSVVYASLRFHGGVQAVMGN